MRTDDEYFDIRYENKDWRKRWHNKITLRSRKRHKYHIRNNMYLPLRHACFELKYHTMIAKLRDSEPLDIEQVAWKIGNNRRRRLHYEKMRGEGKI